MKKNLNDSKRGEIELLAPAGSIEAGYAALHYGADAIYLGLENFSARSSAVNFAIEELADITGYAHSLPGRRKIYVAVNTLVLQSELGGLIDLMGLVAAIGVDAVIVQDFGVLHILRGYFPQVKIHASTQMAIHNLQGAEAARKMSVGRVTLSRELTLREITGIAAKSGIETEIFIHGALCYSYSGLCLFSSHLYGRSGNRGKCAYPCREWFVPEFSAESRQHSEKKGGFIFSMKDLALPDYVTELRRIGVSALKIEGRMKSPLYVAAAVNYYRRLIDGGLSHDKERELAAEVQTIFSRPWTDLYLKTRRSRGVTDIETQGHRGSPAGMVEEIVKNQGGHALRFKTNLPVELHDGLQIDIAGQPRPFGFAVKNINIIGTKVVPGQKRVFTAPAGARIEVQIPRGHPLIPEGAVIYSSSSQKVKQQYDFHRPKPGQFRLRQAADFDIRVNETGFDLTASTNVFPAIKNEKVRVEVKKHYEENFQPADNIGRAGEAFTKAFGKLGDTNLTLGRLAVDNPRNLFVPISRLNSIRRDISAALEEEIAALPRKYAEKIKSEVMSQIYQVPSQIASKLDVVIPDMSRSQGASGLDRESRENLKLDSLVEFGQAGRPASAGMTEPDSSPVTESRSGNETVGAPLINTSALAKERLNLNWSIKTDQPHLLESFDADDWREVDEVIIECILENPAEFYGRLEQLAGAVGKERMRLSIPVIIRQWEMESLAKTVSELISKGWQKWQVSGLGGLALLSGMQNNGIKPDISADWPLYAMNRAAVLELKALGVSRFTLSPEDGFENMRVLLTEFSESASVIVYQDTPLMISETCVYASDKCSWPDKCNFRETVFGSSHGDRVRVISRNCRSIVLNARPFCLAGHLRDLAEAGAANFRADFIYREYSGKELVDAWRKLRSGNKNLPGHIGNFQRGLG